MQLEQHLKEIWGDDYLVWSKALLNILQTDL